MEVFVFLVYMLTGIWIGYWLGVAIERKAQKQTRCSHTWDYRSLDGLDHHWGRACLVCGLYESLNPEQVPYHERCKARNFRG